MIQFSTTLYGTFEYKPLLLNSVWGFHSRKGPAWISDVISVGETGQKAESWQWKVPVSFILPSTPLQLLWPAPKPWQELNTAFHWVTYLALEEHTLVELASGPHFHSLCTTVFFNAFQTKTKPRGFATMFRSLYQFYNGMEFSCTIAGWICPWNLKYSEKIDRESFTFLNWVFYGFGLFLEYLPFHLKSIHNHFVSFFRNEFNLQS